MGYQKFTDALNEVLASFEMKINSQSNFACVVVAGGCCDVGGGGDGDDDDGGGDIVGDDDGGGEDDGDDGDSVGNVAVSDLDVVV